MSIAALVRTLLDANVSADVIVAAVEAVESRPAGAAAEERRSAAAERQARYRERKAEAVTLGITSVTNPVTCITSVTSVTAKESVSPTPPSKENNPPSKNPPLGGQKGSRLSPDWQPSSAEQLFAEGLGFSTAQAAVEFDKFRDFWIAKPGAAGVKIDWPATMRNWLRRSAEMRGIAPPNVTLPVPTGPPPVVKTQAEILAELEALEAMESNDDHRSELPFGGPFGDEGKTAEHRRVTRIYAAS